MFADKGMKGGVKKTPPRQNEGVKVIKNNKITKNAQDSIRVNQAYVMST